MTSTRKPQCESMPRLTENLGLVRCSKTATHLVDNDVNLCETHHAEWVRRGWCSPGRRLTR